MTEQTAITKANTSIVASVSDLQTIAQIFIKSGFFQDVRDLAQAQVKIMAGREIGLEPFASMSGIHVIKGKITYGANILAAKVKGSGRYDYRVREMTDKACRIMFYQLVNGKWEEIGPSDFTIEDARKAGTQNLDKFPRNMLFARAISNGQKWYCPDVTSGVTMYTPEEFGAVVDDSGKVVEVDGQAVTEGRATEVSSEQPANSLSGFKTTTPVQTPTKMTPRTSSGLDGLMTPKILVDNGYCKDIPEAAKLLNTLKIAGKPAAEGMEIVKAHFAKSQPADDDNDLGSHMPDPRTGDGDNML